MNSNDMIEKIEEIILNNIGREIDLPLDPNCELHELGMTSIIFIQIVVDLEKIFDIEIPDEQLIMTEMGTLNRIINVVQELLRIKEE